MSKVERRQALWRVRALPLVLVLIGLLAMATGKGQAGVPVEVEEVPPALDRVNDLPPIPNLDKFLKDINDLTAVIKLGKALFWDMQAGSDGQSCASCHFHAGADNRRKNQLSPGLLVNPADETFDPTASGAAGGPNYSLVNEDFPFHQKVNENDRSLAPSNVKFDTNDVASSQGAFNADFMDVVPGELADICDAMVDAIFNVDNPSVDKNNNTRRVEPRHTPTIYNAALNFDNFWDGRAKNNFNGVNPFGLRDDLAFVWQNNGVVQQVQLKGPLELINSSLASQAVGPPLSSFEMSCANRIFPKIGEKLIPSEPLKFQRVHADDSVLRDCRDDTDGNGLATTYEAMIQAAFKNEWWDAPGLVDGQFTHMQANFSLFWGIATMMYQRTLLSDQSRFDQFRRGEINLSAQELRGLAVFMDKGRCVNCHATAAFTKASTLHLIAENQEEGLVERMLMGDQDRGPALYDNGFYNIGVRPTTDDIGRGGLDPISNTPLSFTRQYIDLLRGLNVPDPFQIDECKFEIRFDNPLNMPPLDLDGNGTVLTASGAAGDLDGDGLSDPFPVGFQFVPVVCNDGGPDTLKPKNPLDGDTITPQFQDDTIANFRTAVDGAMKVPTLRNIAVLGPFFHNGGNATLFQVASFYNRGGDFFEVNEVDVDPDIVPLFLTRLEQLDLVAFLKTLTDPRVVNEEDTYDHPQLFVPKGGTAAEVDVLDCATENQPKSVVDCDNVIVVPAIGRFGRSAEGLGKLQPFQKSPTSGDLNNDNKVDRNDVFVLFAALGTCRGDVGFNEDADYDTNNCINFEDHAFWHALFTIAHPPAPPLLPAFPF